MSGRDGLFVQQGGAVTHETRLRPGVLKLRSLGNRIPGSRRLVEAAPRAARPLADPVATLCRLAEKHKLEIRG